MKKCGHAWEHEPCKNIQKQVLSIASKSLQHKTSWAKLWCKVVFQAIF
jgi:hypothetical protein